jgi:hypothetical protein
MTGGGQVRLHLPRAVDPFSKVGDAGGADIEAYDGQHLAELHRERSPT